MDIRKAGEILEKNIRPIRDSLMVPPEISYGCVAGCDLKAKEVLTDEEITEEHVVIYEGTRIGRAEAGVISALGLFEVRIRRPARIAVISVAGEPAGRFPWLKMNESVSPIPAMLEYSITDLHFEVSMNSSCGPDEKSLCRELRKGVRGSDLVITAGGISGGGKDPVFEALSALGGKALFKNAGSSDALNGAYILEKKVVLCLCADPENAVKDFDSFFGCCASSLMQCEICTH